MMVTLQMTEKYVEHPNGYIGITKAKCLQVLIETETAL